MPRRPRLRCLLLAGAFHLAVAAPAGAVAVGLPDQQPGTFADPRVRALGLRYARVVVPWDAATSEPARVQAWLDAVAAAGMRRCVRGARSSPATSWTRAPTCAGCSASWRPRRWRRACGACTTTATRRTAGRPARTPSWRRYRAGCLEETGGIVTIRDATGRETLPADEARAARGVDRAFAIAARRPRITRMYLYQWRAGASDRFDAGLVRPDGTTRAGLAAVRRGLAALTPLRWSASWSGRRLVVRATCPAAVLRCAGRVRIALRTGGRRATGAEARALGARAYRTAAARRTVTLRVAVPSALRCRARVAATRTVVLRVSASAPLAASSTASLQLERPA